MKVGYHTVGNTEIIRRENEFVGPALKRFKHAIGRDRSLKCPHHGSTNGTDTMLLFFGSIDNIYRFLFDPDLFRVHLVFGQILHINTSEVSEANVKRDLSKIYSLDFESCLL